MSVTWAPRARIAVNASWPGVSMNVMSRSPTCAWYAPMCWVMPPNSPATTSVSRIESSSLVLPWSTCPMTVTTGGRGTSRDSSTSSSSPSSRSSSASPTTSASMPRSVATSAIASSDNDVVAVAISPERNRIFTISAGPLPSLLGDRPAGSRPRTTRSVGTAGSTGVRATLGGRLPPCDSGGAASVAAAAGGSVGTARNGGRGCDGRAARTSGRGGLWYRRPAGEPRRGGGSVRPPASWPSACEVPAPARAPLDASGPRSPCLPTRAVAAPGPRARSTRRICPPRPCAPASPATPCW